MNVTGFPHQVGGHFGIFVCGGHICKPLNAREIAFYEEIGDRFAPFTPQCCGSLLFTLSVLALTLGLSEFGPLWSESVWDHRPLYRANGGGIPPAI